MNHLEKIMHTLEEYDLDAMLITSESGERYALGFHGEGLLIVTRERAHYSTDARYILAAREQVTGAQVKLANANNTHMAQAIAYLKEHHIRHLGFESGVMSVDTFEKYSKNLPATLVPAQMLLDTLRAGKDEQELVVMRRAQTITEAAFDAILNFIRPDMTEAEIAARLVYEMLRRGAQKVSFDPIVAAGANGACPHAVPSQQRVQKGMFITMDFGCKVDGYCSDMTRTVALGAPTQEMAQVYDIVLRAQLAAIDTARAGIEGRAIDAAARAVIETAGYGAYFTHSLGHSLGLDIHESPNAAVSETRIMPVGAVISAEPAIYLPEKFGVRIEDVLVLDAQGCTNLTHAPKQLIVL